MVNVLKMKKIQMHFVELIILYLVSEFMEICSWDSDDP